MRRTRTLGVALVLAIVLVLLWTRRISTDEIDASPTKSGTVSTSLAGSGETLESGSEGSARAQVDPPPATASFEADDEDLLRGRVVDPKSSPVPGAEVQVVRSEGRIYEYLGDHEFWARTTRVAETRSDTDGAYSVRLPRGRVYELRVRAEPFAVKQVYGVRAGDSVVVTLRAGATISGVVRRSSDGPPIPGVRLLIENEEGYEPMWDGATDANGRYVAQGLDPGSVNVRVIPVEERPTFVDLELREGEQRVQDFDLVRGGTIEGEVRDRSTGLPIAGAEVSSWSFLHKIARTDAAGRYVLSGFRDRANQQIATRAEGYGETETRIAVKDGETVRADFELTWARTLRGRVVTRAQDPVDGAYVAALALGSEPGIPRRECRASRTGADGRFEIRNLRRDLPHAAFVRKDGFATTIFDLGDREQAVPIVEVGDVVLPRMSTLSGRVVDAAGAGVAGASIQLRTPRPGAAVNTEALAMVSTATGDDGRFRFVDLSGGTQRLRIHKPGFPTLEAIDVELLEAEARRDLVITLGGELTISGRVLDPDGAGVSGARVFFTGPSLSPRSFPSAITTEGGAFVILGLEPGEYSLKAQPEENRSDCVAARFGPVRAGADGVTLQLGRLALVQGRVRGPERAWIVAFDETSARIDWTVSDTKGTFRIRAAEGSTLELQAWKAKRDPQSYWGWSADESAAPFAVVPGIRAGATDVVIE